MWEGRHSEVTMDLMAIEDTVEKRRFNEYLKSVGNRHGDEKLFPKKIVDIRSVERAFEEKLFRRKERKMKRKNKGERRGLFGNIEEGLRRKEPEVCVRRLLIRMNLLCHIQINLMPILYLISPSQFL